MITKARRMIDCAPHTRGDEPWDKDKGEDADLCSPHPWG